MAKQSEAKVGEGGGGPLLIDPMWILKTVGAVILAAAVCGYITLCLLFWQGAWQLVLHPSHTSAVLQMPGVPTDPVRFAADEAGRPQLTGVWIPGSSQYAVLYLRGGDGSLATDTHDAQTLRLLHESNLSVLAFDWRGYGESVTPHPSEERMQQDARRAFAYLTSQRGVAADHVIVWGVGVGSSLAAAITDEHASVAGLVVDQPVADAAERVESDGRGRIMPTGLLFRDRFDLATPLQAATAPKLLLYTEVKSGNDAVVQKAFREAASPKMVYFLPPGTPASDALRRFLDERVPGVVRTTFTQP